LCGPLPHASLSRSRYFLTFIDDFSWNFWTDFLKVRSEAFEKFKVLKRMIGKPRNEKDQNSKDQ
jgi:hypothetical protein